MSQIKYKNKTYGASPFAFFKDKAAAEAARQAGRIVPGQIVITLDDTIGQMMAASVGYDNSESGLDATDVQGAIDEVKNDLGSVTLITTAQNVHGAINELNSDALKISDEWSANITTTTDSNYYNAYGIYNGYKNVDEFTGYSYSIWSKRVAVIITQASIVNDSNVPVITSFHNQGYPIVATLKPGLSCIIKIKVLYK